MKKYIVLFFSLLLFACGEREVPNPVGPSVLSISKHKIPAFMNPGKSYTISVSVQSGSGGHGQKIDSVRLAIFKKGDTAPSMLSALYDDGQAVRQNNGDIVAHDGIFTQTMTWDPGVTGREKYFFEFSAANNGGTSAEPLRVEVVSLDNVPPLIVSAVVPDSLSSGFDSARLELAVIDSNGTDDIKSAVFHLMKDQTSYGSGELLPGSSTGAADSGEVRFSVQLDSSFAAGKLGRFDISFEAIDRSDAVSEPYKRDIYIENLPPVVFNLDAAAFVEKPKTGITTTLLKISVRDPQSLDDIKQVKLSWQKPDSSYAGESPFDLYDNGKPFDLNPAKWQSGYRGDEVAGDGVYSITGVFDPSQPSGHYKLIFWAVDLAGQKSNQIVHYVEFK